MNFRDTEHIFLGPFLMLNFQYFVYTDSALRVKTPSKRQVLHCLTNLNLSPSMRGRFIKQFFLTKEGGWERYTLKGIESRTRTGRTELCFFRKLYMLR